MATHSSILAWKIPWTEALGRLQSIGLQKSWIRLLVIEHRTSVFYAEDNLCNQYSSRGELIFPHLLRICRNKGKQSKETK